MADKKLTTGELRALIDHHARCIIQEFGAVQLPNRESVMSHIDRLEQLAKAMPRIEYAQSS